MSKDLVIVGTGGSGRETLFLLDDIQSDQPRKWNFRGFLADSPPDPEMLERLGAEYLGSPTDPELLHRFRGFSFAVGIGSGSVRRQVESDLLAAGLKPATLIHPSVRIGRDVRIGSGSVISTGCVITTNVHLGVSIQLNLNCMVCHDSILDDYCTLTPGVSVTGNVKIEEEVYVGTNACFIPGVRVGARSIIGAGAVVIRDVPPDSVATGVPAVPRPRIRE